MDTNTNDNKFDIKPESLMIRGGKLLVSDRWLCSRFQIPYQVFYKSVMVLPNRPFSDDLRWFLSADDFGALMLTSAGDYFTIEQAAAVADLLRGGRE